MSVHEHLKHLMVDNLRDCALVVLDPDGKVLSWNAGAKGLLGYDETEAVGLPFSRIVPPETLDPAGAPASLAIARKTGRHEEICQRVHSNGSGLELREVVIPLRDPQHNLVAFGLMMQTLDAAKAAAGKPAVSAARKVHTVLLVDDDDGVRTMAAHLLEDMGYEVLVAASGADALDILARDESIDVLFTDVVMPGMDGGELAEQARLMRPDLSILFASGYFEHALVKKGTIKRNTNLLVKPYSRWDLARKMKTALAVEAGGSDDLLRAAS